MSKMIEVSIVGHNSLTVKESQFRLSEGWEFEELPTGGLRVRNDSYQKLYTLPPGRWEARHEWTPKDKPAREKGDEKRDRIR